MKIKTIILSSLLLWCGACSHKENHVKGNEPVVQVAKTSQNNLAVIYNSFDGGRTWIPYDIGIPKEATVSSFAVVDDRIFASTDYHGIYLIKEGEKLWKRIDEDLPEKVDVNAIAVIGNSIIIGTLSHGIMISENNGKNWRYPARRINNIPIRCLYTNGNMVLAGADNGIHRSMNKGDTWEHVNNGVQVNGFTEVNHKIYAALMNGATMTNDNGLTWTYIYKPHTLHDISTDGKHIYAMTLGAGLKKSGNDGRSWQDVNNGLGTYNLYTFELKRFDEKIFAAQWYGIYVSDNGGQAWSLIRNGLPDSTAFLTLEKTRNGLIAGIGRR